MFSSLLKELRAQKGITQSQLAKEAGVSPGNVGDWETGKSKPGYNALAALTRIFEVSADYLLELNTDSENARTDLSAYKLEQGLVCDGSPLSDAEADLVAIFRLLPPMRQEELFDLAYFQYERHVERKKKSIYWTFLEDAAAKEENDITQPVEARNGIA